MVNIGQIATTALHENVLCQTLRGLFSLTELVWPGEEQ